MAKLKRAQGIALVCVLALGLSACSSSGNDSSEELSGELNLFLIPSPSSTSIQSFIPEFEANTGVKVNVSETPYGEAHQKQLLSYKQKAGAYDIAQFDNSFLAPFCQSKAIQIIELLHKECEQGNVEFQYNCKTENIELKDQIFNIKSTNQKFQVRDDLFLKAQNMLLETTVVDGKKQLNRKFYMDKNWFIRLTQEGQSG